MSSSSDAIAVTRGAEIVNDDNGGVAAVNAPALAAGTQAAPAPAGAAPAVPAGQNSNIQPKVQAAKAPAAAGKAAAEDQKALTCVVPAGMSDDSFKRIQAQFGNRIVVKLSEDYTGGPAHSEQGAYVKVLATLLTRVKYVRELVSARDVQTHVVVHMAPADPIAFALRSDKCVVCTARYVDGFEDTSKRSAEEWLRDPKASMQRLDRSRASAGTTRTYVCDYNVDDLIQNFRKVVPVGWTATLVVTDVWYHFDEYHRGELCELFNSIVHVGRLLPPTTMRLARADVEIGGNVQRRYGVLDQVQGEGEFAGHVTPEIALPGHYLLPNLKRDPVLVNGVHKETMMFGKGSKAVQLGLAIIRKAPAFGKNLTDVAANTPYVDTETLYVAAYCGHVVIDSAHSAPVLVSRAAFDIARDVATGQRDSDAQRTGFVITLKRRLEFEKIDVDELQLAALLLYCTHVTSTFQTVVSLAAVEYGHSVQESHAATQASVWALERNSTWRYLKTYFAPTVGDRNLGQDRRIKGAVIVGCTAVVGSVLAFMAAKRAVSAAADFGRSLVRQMASVVAEQGALSISERVGSTFNSFTAMLGRMFRPAVESDVVRELLLQDPTLSTTDALASFWARINGDVKDQYAFWRGGASTLNKLHTTVGVWYRAVNTAQATRPAGEAAPVEEVLTEYHAECARSEPPGLARTAAFAVVEACLEETVKRTHEYAPMVFGLAEAALARTPGRPVLSLTTAIFRVAAHVGLAALPFHFAVPLHACWNVGVRMFAQALTGVELRLSMVNNYKATIVGKEIIYSNESSSGTASDLFKGSSIDTLPFIGNICGGKLGYKDEVPHHLKVCKVAKKACPDDGYTLCFFGGLVPTAEFARVAGELVLPVQVHSCALSMENAMSRFLAVPGFALDVEAVRQRSLGISNAARTVFRSKYFQTMLSRVGLAEYVSEKDYEAHLEGQKRADFVRYIHEEASKKLTLRCGVKTDEKIMSLAKPCRPLLYLGQTQKEHTGPPWYTAEQRMHAALSEYYFKISGDCAAIGSHYTFTLNAYYSLWTRGYSVLVIEDDFSAADASASLPFHMLAQLLASRTGTIPEPTPEQWARCGFEDLSHEHSQFVPLDYTDTTFLTTYYAQCNRRVAHMGTRIMLSDGNVVSGDSNTNAIQTTICFLVWVYALLCACACQDAELQFFDDCDEEPEGKHVKVRTMKTGDDDLTYYAFWGVDGVRFANDMRAAYSYAGYTTKPIVHELYSLRHSVTSAYFMPAVHVDYGEISAPFQKLGRFFRRCSTLSASVGRRKVRATIAGMVLGYRAVAGWVPVVDRWCHAMSKLIGEDAFTGVEPIMPNHVYTPTVALSVSGRFNDWFHLVYGFDVSVLYADIDSMKLGAAIESAALDQMLRVEG